MRRGAKRASTVAAARAHSLARSRASYHFAATEEQFYQRPPYVNRQHANDFERTHVTRFIALATAFNANNQKVGRRVLRAFVRSLCSIGAAQK